jgi:CRISPR-associated endonuclease/helicase Cas3
MGGSVIAPPFAHLTPEGRQHALRDHLEGVANLAARFAQAFGSDRWGYLAGLWHDLGKYAADFQAYIRSANGFEAHIETTPGKVDHSSAGAIHAIRQLGWGAKPLALVIAGHHAGLADLDDELRPRLAAKEPRLQEAISNGAPTDLLNQTRPDPPESLRTPFGRDMKEFAERRYELWVRLLFSALVDADFLDTEAFFAAGRAELRGNYPSVSTLRDRLAGFLTELTAAADDTPVNRARALALADCKERAADSPGLFSLTVPTGGGKTLAAMAFGLEHALKHGLQRIVVVIPYTSIIEQNAAVYAAALGPGAVVEHHSAIDPEIETPRNRIASENWDAPVVVTTSVQFFESLFANRPSRCRKLHNLVRAVILLDEVQTLPPGLLGPILDALRDLAEVYGSTVVLSTATQPALARRSTMPFGLENVREIITPDTSIAFGALTRTRVEWPATLDQPVEWSGLADRIAAEERALAIVHRRADARELIAALDEVLRSSNTYHLSALMCPAHRSSILGRIRSALRDPGQVRVISTQLVEAGVDLDFPVVFRALGGLDAITQAAGRCNREGKLRGPNGEPVLGRVEVFVSPTQPPPGVPRASVDVTRALLRSDPALDPFDSDACERFFRGLYSSRDLDVEGIQAMRQALCFRSVARSFRIIEDGWQEPIVVPWGDARSRVEQLKRDGPSRRTLRALQRFVVSIPKKTLTSLQHYGAAELVADTAWVISRGYERLYDERLGLQLDAIAAADSEG